MSHNVNSAKRRSVTARRFGHFGLGRLALCVSSAALPLIAALPLVAQPAAPTPTIKPSLRQQIAPAPAFSTKQLVEPAASDWATNGGNLYNQRYSSLSAINRDNIKDLKAVWRTHLNGSGIGAQYSGQGQPIVYDGVIYIVTGNDDVFALDVKTGATLWNYQAKLDSNRVRVCCGWISRGVGLGAGKVFLGQLDAKLVALDQRSGNVLWSIQAQDPLQGYSIVGAPLYYDGMVIVGLGGADMGIRGQIKAFDAKNGKPLWTFYTIPAPGEFGSNTWPTNSDIWKYGGASVWQTPAVDPELGLLYFSTGNAGSTYNGGTRPGDNLFTASILAIEAKTGKYRWHFQQVHHDIWDYDSPNPVILFDAPYEGKTRKAVAEVSKTGWVYILDRATGKPLLDIDEKPVPQEPRQATAATQPYPVGDAVVPQSLDIAPEGQELINGGRIFTPYWDKPVSYRPQMGVNWPPSSYDPATNLMYLCAIDHVGTSFSDTKGDAKEFDKPTFDGMWNKGGAGYSGIAGRGIFAAMDLKTNRLVWRQQWRDDCWSGSLTTAGGLVFVGRSDGRLTALDSRNGDRLWQFQTDSGVNAPASTFEYQGQQYVVVLSAGTLFAAGAKKGDSVWLFSTTGTLESFPVSVGRPTALLYGGHEPQIDFAPGNPDLANGKKLFHTFCTACHGDTGLGSHGGANLQNASKDAKFVITTATTGRGDMPSFKGVLTPEQFRDVAGYITTDLFPSH
jgi:quinohemoprotein ethanol dehydrogenase